MIFSYFAVPPQFQQRALIWGVIGAIILRAIMIFIGAALIAQFHWILYFFGAFLVLTGAKMLWAAGQQSDLNDNPILKWLRGHLRVTDKHHDEKLWIVENGKRFFTPMFLVLIMIAVTDVIFAVDSIPAIFAITTDPFIVLTSNVFAVLGLRALYFLLAGMADKFHLLAYGSGAGAGIYRYENVDRGYLQDSGRRVAAGGGRPDRLGDGAEPVGQAAS